MTPPAQRADPTAHGAPPLPDIARHIWETRYRNGGGRGCDADLDATWRRVATALAAAERDGAGRDRRDEVAQRFLEILSDGRFLPGGRILAGAGTGRRVTLFNCFVMGTLDDSMRGIFRALEEGALTMQQGGGIGVDFSPLRPAGALARRSGAIASGPVSFMHLWDGMCATLQSTGARRGAMMGTLRCDHPDIETFVDAKRDGRALRRFNLSVLVTDAFMAAVAADADWPLVFPFAGRRSLGGEGHVMRDWSGAGARVPCRVQRVVKARALWERVLRATYDCAEPGVIFIDRVRRLDNLSYGEVISATNPCGEIPLPPYGACDLGSINLTRFVRDPFGAGAALDLPAIAATARVAVRLLDNVYEVSHFPLPRQAAVARSSRRLGLGITGLGDALIMLGLVYGTPPAIGLAREVMRTICHAAYRASIELARKKGPFPAFVARDHLAGEFIRGLPADIVDGIARHGIRNSHLTAIAPTGTISLLAGNVSSGLEPAFAFTLHRNLRAADGSVRTMALEDYAYRLYRHTFGADAPLTPAFVAAAAVKPAAQLAMQAALQAYVDNAISKTVTVPADIAFEDFRAVYDDAYRLGLKGCSAFRPNAVTGAVLEADPPAGAVPR